mgnify:CR=1 FL=1
MMRGDQRRADRWPKQRRLPFGHVTIEQRHGRRGVGKRLLVAILLRASFGEPLLATHAVVFGHGGLPKV